MAERKHKKSIRKERFGFDIWVCPLCLSVDITAFTPWVVTISVECSTCKKIFKEKRKMQHYKRIYIDTNEILDSAKREYILTRILKMKPDKIRRGGGENSR